MKQTIEAAFLAGYEPSADNLTEAQVHEEAIAYLISTNK
jgi:hypothetical protein